VKAAVDNMHTVEYGRVAVELYKNRQAEFADSCPRPELPDLKMAIIKPVLPDCCDLKISIYTKNLVQNLTYKCPVNVNCYHDYNK